MNEKRSPPDIVSDMDMDDYGDFVVVEFKRKFPWWYPPRQVFEFLGRFRGFKIGCVRLSPLDMCLVLLLNGPWIQRFRKDHGRPGEIWNPKRWGGAFIGLKIGDRG